MRLHNKSKSKDYTDIGDVNEAGTWSESGLSYRGRPHGRVIHGVKLVMRSQPTCLPVGRGQSTGSRVGLGRAEL